MKINMLCKTLLLAGLTAAMLTGCGNQGYRRKRKSLRPHGSRSFPRPNRISSKLCRPIQGQKLLRQKPVPSAVQKRKVKAARE